MSDWLVTILLGVIAAGPIIFGVWAQLQKTKHETADKLIDNLQEQNTNCLEEERKLRREVRDLETENRLLRRQNWENSSGAMGGGRGPYPE